VPCGEESRSGRRKVSGTTVRAGDGAHHAVATFDEERKYLGPRIRGSQCGRGSVV
jgi:hypothetical protein